MRRRRLVYLSIIAIVDPDVVGNLIFTLVGPYKIDSRVPWRLTSGYIITDSVAFWPTSWTSRRKSKLLPRFLRRHSRINCSCVGSQKPWITSTMKGAFELRAISDVTVSYLTLPLGYES